MAIYLGNTLLTSDGSGGGGAIPVNSYAVFYGETATMIETDEGSIWLQTGSVLTSDGSGTATDAAIYTDASGGVSLTGTTFTSSTNWFGGGSGIGIQSDFENNMFYTHADNSATIYRWVDIDSTGTPQNARGSSNPAQFENQVTSSANVNQTFEIGGNTLIYNQGQATSGRGSTSRGFSLSTSGSYPQYNTSTAQYTPDSSNIIYFAGAPLGCTYSDGTDRIVHSLVNEARDFANQFPTGYGNTRDIYTVLWNVDGVTAAAAGNLTDSQRVGIYPGYALKISDTQFVTITGPDQGSGSSTTSVTATTRNFSDGVATATTTLANFNTSFYYNRDRTHRPTVGTINGQTYYNLSATGTTNGVPSGLSTASQTYNQAAQSIGDSTAKFTRWASANTGTLAPSGQAQLYVKIGNAEE